MKDIHYLGRFCRNGHNDTNNQAIRYKSTKNCVDCTLASTNKARKENTNYKDYQAAYHQRLRASDPAKLVAYYETQKERGHTYTPVKERTPLATTSPSDE